MDYNLEDGPEVAPCPLMLNTVGDPKLQRHCQAALHTGV